MVEHGGAGQAPADLYGLSDFQRILVMSVCVLHTRDQISILGDAHGVAGIGPDVLAVKQNGVEGGYVAVFVVTGDRPL